MPPSRSLLAPVAAGAGLVALILLADRLRQPATPEVALWPASGLALGALLVAPRRAWIAVLPALGIGALVATVLLRPDDPVLRLVLRPLAELVGPVLAVLLVRAPRRRREPSPAQGVLEFLLAVVVGSAAGGLAITAASLGGLAADSIPRVVDTWAATGIGMLVVGPAVLAVAGSDEAEPGVGRSALLALGAVALALLVFVVPGRDLPPALSYPFVVLPLLLAAAVRGAPRAAALTAVAIVTIAWVATASGLGPVFRQEIDPADRVRALQALVATVALSSLLVVAETSARRRASRALATSEERYRTLVQGMPDAMALLWDAEHRCVAADGPMLAREGLRREDLVDRHLDEVLPAEQVAVLRPLLDAALDGRTGQTEISSGRRGRLYEAEAVPVHAPAGGRDGAYLVLRDVSERRRQELGVRRAEADLATTFRDAPVGRALLDAEGRLRDADATFAEITGRPAAALEALPAARLVGARHRADLRDALGAVRDGRIPRAELELDVVHPSAATGDDAEDVTVACVAHVAPPGDGAGRDGDAVPAVAELLLVDVTDERLADEQLASLARRDPLTGLASRAAFTERVDPVAATGPAAGALLLIGVDGFAELNVALGRHAGDALLVALADLLREMHDQHDHVVLGRVGGDVLAALVPGLGADDAAREAERLVVAVRERHGRGSGPATDHPVTVSCGVVALAGRPATGEAIVGEGELALQDAKNGGRDRWARHAPPATTAPRGRRRLEWIERLDDALEHDGFVLEAQPIERLEDGAVTQHELLLRMRDDDGALIPPGRFLPVAERFGLVGRIDRWVLGRAIDLLERLAAAGSPTRLEVNVSGRSLGDPLLLQTIEEGLARSGVAPSRLVLEITETAAVGDVERARRFSDRLGELGCGFALDDFGVGFGSFYYLKHLRWDYLKIDGEFVRGCLNDRSDRLVIDALVRLAHGLDRRTIAEYVGDPATRAHLRASGVDLVQGSHVGRPVPLHRAFPELDAGAPAPPQQRLDDEPRARV